MKWLKRVPLPAIRVFEAAGRNCSFVEAARELDLSASAVSHAIRKLEATAGVGLFIRNTRHTELTAAGALLLEHIQRGFEEMSRGFTLATAEKSVPLRVHAAPTFASQWLVPRIAGFMHKHPHIDLHISASTNYATFDNDDFDLDIVYGHPGAQQHEIAPLNIEQLTPLCCPALAEHIRHPQDLYKQLLIQNDGSAGQWREWFTANGMPIPRNYALAFDRSSISISAAVDGLGVIIESDLLAARELATGQLVSPLRELSNSIRIVGHYLVHPRRQRQPEAVKHFRDWLFVELQRPGA
ncbi:LysR substrate-binding domain-containing protein [Pseudomonas sp. NPDC089407]|uniref:LysR substrate-binding domain-containing protein n=1 Tax=Pseudomonas sp. NPDC089407 TaxID=3364464 RepID=UPI00385045AE